MKSASSRKLLRRRLALVLLAVASFAGALTAQEAEPVVSRLRLGFSTVMFIGVNENDARVSVKAFATIIAHEHDIPADPDPVLLPGTDSATELIVRYRLGAVSMTTAEFWLLRRKLGFDRFLVSSDRNDPTETYLVVAREDGPVKTLANLRDRRLVELASPRMSLAAPWLDVALAKADLPPAAQLLRSIDENPKPTKVVLPVFFNQADACLITRRAFDTMAELNPQVGRQMRVVASSPAYIPAVMGFRDNLSPELKQHSIQAFNALNSVVYGRQTLAIFHTENVVEQPAAGFDGAFALLEEHARLCPAASAALVAGLRSPRPEQPKKP